MTAPSLVRLLARVGWPSVTVVALHGVIAEVFGHVRALDPAMHLLGGAALAYAGCQGLAVFGPSRVQSMRAVVLALVALVAVVWEVAELASDRYLGTTVVHGLADTATDLVLGIAGAAILLFIAPLLGWTRNG